MKKFVSCPDCGKKTLFDFGEWKSAIHWCKRCHVAFGFELRDDQVIVSALSEDEVNALNARLYALAREDPNLYIIR